jgi:hypothetical protein
VRKTEVNTELKTEEEAVVKLETEHLGSFFNFCLFVGSELFSIPWFARQLHRSVFDQPESVVEIQDEEESNS